MGIIRAAASAVSGTLADQWKETIEAGNMDNKTILTKGVLMQRGDKRNHNRKGSADIITDGSVIHVAENQFMLLVDGGKIIDYSAEPGYFTVQTGSAPSVFNGNFGSVLDDAFNRFKFGGAAPARQEVYYINMQEIRNIPFGTPAPINYFDNFYNAELYLRANGYYSIKVANPLKFFVEMGNRDGGTITVSALQQSCLSEFLNAFQTAISKMSAEGERISHVASKGMELAKAMSTVLDEEWNERRGMMIESVGINSITYDEESKKLIALRNQGAMLSDASIREGYIQGAAARGMEAAGSNRAGAATAFMGMNMGMQSAGGFMGAASESNRAQMAQQQAAQQAQAAQAQQAAADSWNCPNCKAPVQGNFCSTCGEKRPQASFCSGCGQQLAADARFCSGCGAKQG